MKITVLTPASLIYLLLIGGCGTESDAPSDTDAPPKGDGGEPGETDTGTEPDDTEPEFDLCERQDTVDVLAGEYRVHNNIWGRSTGVGEQCIRGRGTAFEVYRSTHSSQSVAAYPFILKGCHLGGSCTENSGMPIRVSDISRSRFTWKVDESMADGSYNVAYESWFSEAGQSSPSAELMVWINVQGSAAVPSGTLEDTIELNGSQWRVFRDVIYNWNYIAYISVDGLTDVDLDFKEFIDDATDRGALDPSWYLDAMEAGFEIWQDGETLRTLSFSAEVE